MATTESSTIPPAEFPQPLTLSQRLDLLILRVNDIVLSALPKIETATCQFESVETGWGRCDGGFQCGARATVHHLPTEQDFCRKHFLQVALRDELAELEVSRG